MKDVPSTVLYGLRVHYLSNKHPWMSVHQISDFVKIIACTSPKKKKEKNEQKHKFTYPHHSHFLSPYVWHFFSRIAAKHAFILLSHFFVRFKLLQNVSKVCLSFLDHLSICFEVPATQFTFQRQKQPEFRKSLSTEWSFPLLIFVILHKILPCYVVQPKHPFSCFHSAILSGSTLFPRASLIFFLSWMKQIPFLLSHIHTWMRQ